MGKKLAAIALLLALPGTTALAQALTPGQIDSFAGKPRVVVLSDIGNEPDDQMSLVRLLLYSNEIDVEALVAVTSTWLKRTTNPDKMHEIVAAYAQVRPNLMRNADGWPEAAKLDDIVTTGQPAYGIAAVGPGLDSPGAEAIIRLVDRPDPRPLWISIWGGANTLAQALTKVRATRSAEALDAFVARLRVYSISDQDDAGPWIRREFPGLTYIATPSRPDSSNYTSATWTGISGDIYYRNGSGAMAGQSPMRGWTSIFARGRWARTIHAICSSWKETRRLFSVSPTMASTVSAIRAGAVGAGVTSGCSLMVKVTPSGAKAATSSGG